MYALDLTRGKSPDNSVATNQIVQLKIGSRSEQIYQGETYKQVDMSTSAHHC